MTAHTSGSPESRRGAVVPPLIPYLVSYASGLILAWAHFFKPLPDYLFPWSFFGGLLCAALARAFGRPLLGRTLLLLLFLIFGAERFHAQISPLPDAAAVFADGISRSIEGRVVRVSQASTGGSQIDLRDASFPLENPPVSLPGIMRVRIEEGTPRYVAGDRIRLWGRCYLPRPFGAPGEADPRIRLLSQGVRMQAKVARAADTVGLHEAGSPGIERLIDLFRLRSGEYIDARLSTGESGVLRSLLLGEKLMLPDDTRDLLAATGTAHLFAISGMHLGLVGGMLYLLLGWFYRCSTRLMLWQPPARILPLLILPVLTGYFLLTGGALPTKRALLMVLLAGAMLWTMRRVSPGALLTAVAFGMLLVAPLALFTPSFQLSFAGAGAILLVAEQRKRRKRGALVSFMVVSIAAILATAPIILAHFSQLAPGSLPGNLIAIPLVGMLALPAGITAILLQGIPLLGDSALQLSSWLIDAALHLLQVLNGLGPVAGRNWYPSVGELCGFTLACSGALAMLRSFRAIFFLPILAGVLLLSFPVNAAKEVRVVAVSVGQGESILLTLPDGEHWLIDGGGLFSEHFDVGERILLPALGRLGVDRIGSLVLTHDHPDHRQGLIAVMHHLPAERVMLGRPLDRHDPLFVEAVIRSGATVEVFRSGWHEVIRKEGLTVSIWRSPFNKGNLNNQSLVIHLEYGGDSLLLTGDLEEEGVSALIEGMAGRSASLLKLPHHGSRKSSPELLIETLQPKEVFLSAGYRNSYGLPSPETLSLLDQRGIRTGRTDLMGTLTFRSSGSGWGFSPTLSGDLY